MMRTIQNLCLMILVTGFTLSAADPILGTWKLNTAKSKSSSGRSMPMSRTLTYTKDGDWIVRESERLDPDGKSRTSVVRHTNDGKENPWGAGRAAVKKLNDYHYEWVFRSDSVGSGKGSTVITRDGKTLTETYAGIDQNGQKVNYVTVYEKQ